VPRENETKKIRSGGLGGKEGVTREGKVPSNRVGTNLEGQENINCPESTGNINDLLKGYFTEKRSICKNPEKLKKLGHGPGHG